MLNLCATQVLLNSKSAARRARGIARVRAAGPPRKPRRAKPARDKPPPLSWKPTEFASFYEPVPAVEDVAVDTNAVAEEVLKHTKPTLPVKRGQESSRVQELGKVETLPAASKSTSRSSPPSHGPKDAHLSSITTKSTLPSGATRPSQASHPPAAAIHPPQPRTSPLSRPPPAAIQPARRPPRVPFRRTALIGALLIVATASGYTTYIWTSYKREAAAAASRNIPADVSDRYQRTAEHFDDDVDWTERLMGIGRLRRALAAKATGHVLEVSVGTGRNMAFLPLREGGVRSVTMLDKSSEMVRMARRKWTDTNPWFIDTAFRVQSGADAIAAPPKAHGGFDTVMQTMGMCSTPEPEAVLMNMGRVCKPDGRILLLEHGRSYYDWLNRKIDLLAPGHADRHGCWYNKDIGAIVARSGLEVVEAKRYHFGTTWWFELKPGAAFRERLAEFDRKNRAVAPSKAVAAAESSLSSLWSWLRRQTALWT